MSVNQDTHTGPSFTLSNRVGRLVWNLVWALLFRLSPRPMHGWRSLLLRLFGAKMGRGCHIYPSVRIWAPWNLICADEACVGDHATLYNQAVVTLGRRAVISQGCHLCTGTHDYESPGFPLYALPIKVGELCWLAAESFVMPGVTIGDGAVIGARSVVTRDLPEWKICAGNPCRVLKDRNFRETPTER